MPRNTYFNSAQGSANERAFLEDMVLESISIWGQDMYYIPRTLVGKDEILGEDRLSRFLNAYPLEIYIENVDGFAGQGAMLQKFGLMMEQSAAFIVPRRRWSELVGRHGQSILPHRPAEGDLIYFPMTKGLFEIKFVQHQDPFYQLGQLYTYRLEVELFQYASERINTGIGDIDVFEDLKSFDESINENIDTPDSYGDNTKFKEEGYDILFTENNPFGEIRTNARISMNLNSTLTVVDSLEID